MALRTELIETHLTNIIFLGCVPTFILYFTIDKQDKFIEAIKSFNGAEGVIYYFAGFFAFLLFLSWNSIWVYVNSRWLRRVIRSVAQAIQSVYYTISGVCFALTAITIANIRTLEELKLIIVIPIVGIIFLFVPIAMKSLLTKSIQSEFT